MKILVISLLRLGDVIQQLPLLASLQKKFPNGEIHILLNKQFSSVAFLLEQMKVKVHYFDRELMQKAMGEAGYNLMTPLDLLEKTIENLNSEKFEIVYNWTHNRLSAFLLGALNVPQKKGLYVQDAKAKGLESAWLKYFNDNFSGSAKSWFHYVEILGKAFDLPYQKTPIRAQQSRNLIVMQCFTSDDKKNWPVKNFAELRGLIKSQGVDVKVLATESEKEKLKGFFPQEEICVADLRQSQELLGRADLLISCDTSIKHLAAHVGTPTLEIALGGSDPVKTSAFSEGAVVVSASAACYPCSHSQKCSQLSHLCSRSVSVAQVHEVYKALAEKTKTERQFEKDIWNCYLDASEIDVHLPSSQAKDLLGATEILIQYQVEFESCENFNQIFSTLNVISEKKLDSGHYFQKLSQVFQDRYANAESALSSLQKALSESRALLEIRMKVINKSLSRVGGEYVEQA